MAVTDQQKLDFLLKKIGYTKTKTGSVVGTGAISGTPKQPFAEAIPSPLIIANGALWNEADSIPTTPPGADTNQVKVYLAATSGLRMTADATSSGQRAYIAYSTYGNTSSTRLTNWIDTQFGASYIIKVYKGDPNSGGVALSAAGSGANDGWFFDYSAGVLNFNDTSVPSGVTDTNIYIVGYRYIGQTGAPTSGISTFSYLDLTVERNLDVGVQGGISTFRNNIDLNADLDVDGHTNLDNLSVAGVSTFAGITTVTGNTLFTKQFNVSGVSTFSGNINLPDSVSAVFGTDDDGSIKHTGTNLQIFETTGNIQITNYANDKDVVISSDDGSGGTTSYFTADGSTGKASLHYYGASKLETNVTGVRFSGHSQPSVNNSYDLGSPSLNWRTVYAKTGDFSGDLDVDGHTNLDNISVAGVSTFTGDATFSGSVSIGGTLTYEDVTNVDSVGLLTARSGIRVTGGVIEALAGENKIPSLYANMAALPAAGSYHGMFAHVHSTGRGYFAHAGNWLELVNADTTGRVGTGTESYFIDRLVSTSTTATSLNVTGVTTAVTVDINGDLDVDGHTNLDNVSVAGVSTFAGITTVTGDTLFTKQFNVSGVSTFFDDVKIPVTNKKLIIGASGQLQLYNQGYHSRIDHVGGHWLTLRSNALALQDASNNYYFDGQSSSGAARLFFSNTPKLATTNTGITVTGTVVADGADINGDLDVDGHTNLDNVNVTGVTTFSETIIFPDAVSGINSTNAPVAKFGNSDDLIIGHDGVNSRIRAHGAGSLILSNNTGIRLQNSSTNQPLLIAIPNGAVSIYHANLKKFETTAQGIEVTGHSELDNVNIVGVTTAAGHILPATDSTYDLGSSSKYWRHVYADNVTGGGGGVIIGDDIITRNLKVNGISTFTGNIDANGDLDVDGHTNLDNVSIAGVTTFTGTAEFDGTAKFDSTITAGGATGTNGQYLKTTGTGVEWATFPTMRTRQTFTASAGQTTFSFTYTVNFLDVFVNGIKLTDAEFTATNGSSVVLAVGCFVGDIVELVSYNTVSGGGGGGGGSLNNIVEDTTPQLGGNLDLFSKTITGTGGINMTGVVTATSFVGNGSGLTGVVASGTGVVIKNSGSTVGTAGTINFGDNLSVSPASAGIVTITGSSNFTNLSVSGIATFSGYVNTGTGATVGIGSTAYVHKIAFAEAGSTNSTLTAALGRDGSNLTFTGGGVQNGYWGNSGLKIGGNGSSATSGPEANCSLHIVSTENTRVLIHGAATAQMELRSTVGNGVENIFKSNKALDFITGTGAYSNVFRVGETEGSTFFHTLNFRASDAASKTVTIDAISGIGTFKGIVVNGATSTISNLNITGVVTATTFKGALEATSASFSSNIDANGDLDVDGHTNLDNVNISGVATVTGNLTVGGSTLQAVNGAFSNNITANQGTFGGNITGPLLNISPASGNDGIILLNSAGGQNNDFSRIRQAIADDSFIIENKSSGSYESFFKGNSDRAAELHYQGNKKLETLTSGAKVTGDLEITGNIINNSKTYTVTNFLASHYVIGGEYDPNLYFARGRTYILNMNASGHPLHIQTVSGQYDSSNLYTTGVTVTGNRETGTITFSVPSDAPDLLYYQCVNHTGMTGKIHVVDQSEGHSDSDYLAYGIPMEVGGNALYENCLLYTSPSPRDS